MVSATAFAKAETGRKELRPRSALVSCALFFRQSGG